MAGDRQFGPARAQPRAEDLKFVMPITILDIILLGVMLVSALLAMIRGFMREILSIAAWVIAAGATLYAYAKLLPFAKTYFNNDIVAAGVVIGGTFLLHADRSCRSSRCASPTWCSTAASARSTARSASCSGSARGLIIVVVAFLFFAWLVPAAHAAGLGRQRQIQGRAAIDRRLADVDVAG